MSDGPHSTDGDFFSPSVSNVGMAIPWVSVGKRTLYMGGMPVGRVVGLATRFNHVGCVIHH